MTLAIKSSWSSANHEYQSSRLSRTSKSSRKSLKSRASQRFVLLQTLCIVYTVGSDRYTKLDPDPELSEKWDQYPNHTVFILGRTLKIKISLRKAIFFNVRRFELVF